MPCLKKRSEHNPCRPIAYCACVPHAFYYRGLAEEAN